MAKAKKASTPGKSKFDFQKFLLEKGDRIGLIIAGVALGLLALFGLMAATSAASPKELAAKLEDGTQTIHRNLEQSADQPPEPEKFEGSFVFRKLGPDDFPTPNPWFNIAGTITDKRGKPMILPVTDSQVRYVQGGIGVYSIQGDQIAILQGKKAAQNNPRNIKFKKKNNPGQQQQPPPGGVAAQPPGVQPPPGMGPPGMQPPGSPPKGGGPPGLGGAGPAVEMEISYIPIDSKEFDTAELAVDLKPVRAAIVTAIVPYKQQVGQYLRALHLENDDALVADKSEPNYAGFDVERMTLSPDGKVLQEWMPFGQIAAYRELNRIAVPDYEDVDIKFKDFLPDATQKLYLPMFKLKRGQPDPLTMPALGRAVEELAKTNAPPKDLSSQRRKRIEDQDDIFSPQQQAPTPGGGPPGAGKGAPMLGEGKGKLLTPGAMAKSGPPGVGMAQQARNNAAPVWMLQFIDPTVEPGKAYRYRVKLRLENPNYGRKDAVVYPGLALEKELESDWSPTEGTEPFTVPPEEYLYAWGDKHKLREAIGGIDYDTTGVQLHRWYDYIRGSGRMNDPIGDWVVAELVAKRGQYVKETKSFKIPMWSLARGDYIFRDRISITGKSKSAAELRKNENVTMEFIPAVDVLLVDFEGGRGAYKLPNGTSITDECAQEILLMTDDGRLFTTTARSTAADKKEEGPRHERQKSWEAWLNEVRAKQ